MRQEKTLVATRKGVAVSCSPAAKWQNRCHGSYAPVSTSPGNLWLTSYSLADSGNLEDWSRLVWFFCGRSSSLTEIRKARESKPDCWPPFPCFPCVINVTSEVGSFGNFPCQQAPGWAVGITGWQRNPSSGTCDVLPQSISASHSAQQGACSSTFPWIISNKQDLSLFATAGSTISPLSLRRYRD